MLIGLAVGAAVMAAVASDWAGRFRHALVAAGLTQKAAALTMGMTEAQLTRALGEEPGANIFLKRLEALPTTFHQEHAVLVLAEHGFPERYVEGARMALVVALGGGSKRMARMVLGESEQRASA